MLSPFNDVEDDEGDGCDEDEDDARRNSGRYTNGNDRSVAFDPPPLALSFSSLSFSSLSFSLSTAGSLHPAFSLR